MNKKIKMKRHFLDKIVTKLSKSEIMEKLIEITHEEKSFNIFSVDNEYFCSGKFDDDTFSLLYLVKGRGDILLPRIYGEIVEKEEGSLVAISYSRTWGQIFVFVFWTIWIWITIKFNILSIILHLLIYSLGILVAKMHIEKINKKSVELLKQTFNE